MGPDELRARQLLLDMQGRLGRDPFEALGLGSSDPGEVRGAFLQLTKIYHPARFARMAVEIQRLSNEVFLSLRAAHDTLSRPQVQARAARQTGVVPVVRPPSTTSNGPPTGGYPAVRPPTGGFPALRPPTGAFPALRPGPAAAPPTAHAARPVSGPLPPGTASAASGTPDPSTASARPTPAPGIARPGRPTSNAATVAARTGPVPTSSMTGGVRPGTTPSSPTRPTAAGGYPVTGSHAPLTRPEPPPPSTPTQPTQSIRTTAAHDASRPTRMPPPSTLGSASGRPGGGDPELASVMELLTEDRLTDARIKLEALVVQKPDVPRYQALIHYAKGREAQLARRIDEARVELMDALQLDADLQLAKTALGELFTRRK